MKEYKDVGQLYKDKFSAFTPEPPAEIWDNIHTRSTKILRRKRILGASLATVAAVAAIFGIVALVNTNQEKTKIEENQWVATSSTTSTTIDKNTDATTAQQPSQPTNNHANIHSTIDIPVHTATQNSKNITPNNNNNDITLSNNNDSNIETNKKIVPTKNNIVPTTEASATTTNSETFANKTSRTTFSNDTTICAGSNISLFVDYASNVVWSTGDRGNIINISPDYDEDISVSFTNDLNKDTSISIHIKCIECTRLYIPNAFTPNGDGLNDVFEIQASEELTYFAINIYDVNKQLIFKSDNINKCWDGTYRGQTLPQGNYLYTIQYKDNLGKTITKRGNILLIK
ncbi:MAG: gliding motility-associated C-terminal domain-containing protein [Bacteroidales bacterium]|nr:gliding motility-associated C-terminal domain-containing protein [Bacteroidales bacterium]